VNYFTLTGANPSRAGWRKADVRPTTASP